MTANAFAEDRQACIVAGMSDFLTKPIPPETLYGTVLHWLQNPLTDREDCAGAGRASDPPVLT
jgi:CheY-like chemotaxis protein